MIYILMLLVIAILIMLYFYKNDKCRHENKVHKRDYYQDGYSEYECLDCGEDVCEDL